MRRLFGPVLLSLTLLLPGCGTPQPRAPEDVVRQAAPPKEPAFFDELEMTREQRKRTLAIIEQLYANFAEYDRVRLILLDETIKQVKAGQLNRDKLMPLAEDTIEVFDAALPDGIEAMQQLHGVLNKEQRQKLVDLFTKQRKMTEEERRAARNEKIQRVLDLTAGQKAKIYPALFALYIKHWGVIGRFRGALHEAQDAFVEDDLVAKNLAIVNELELLAVGEVIFDALRIGLNNLTEEQHQTLAALLDAQLRSPNPTKSDDERPSPQAESESESESEPEPESGS